MSNNYDEEEDYYRNRLTPKWIKDLLKKEWRQYYTTPYLNDILHLHHKGFPKIENLEEFTGLKCLYMESNGLCKIEGLDTMVNMRSLYLHENCFKKIEGLDN